MKLTRRNFLQNGAAVAGSGMLLSGTAPVYSLPGKHAQPTVAGATKEMVPLTIKAQKKALVFIMLDGGNDSFNMLVPTSKRDYADYQNSRSNLALDNSSLLPLSGYKDAQGRTFGLHPAMPEVQQLFTDKKLAIMANIAPMIEPVAKADFYSGAARLPLGLLSHADQFKHCRLLVRESA